HDFADSRKLGEAILKAIDKYDGTVARWSSIKRCDSEPLASTATVPRQRPESRPLPGFQPGFCHSPASQRH
ncbi:hypothetical protein ACTXQV_79530, partial [Klebsiella pneumoniae]